MTTTVTERREPAGPPAGGGSRRLTERVFRVREFGIIAVLVVFVAVTTSIQPSFLNQQNLQFLLINTTVYALLGRRSDAGDGVAESLSAVEETSG